MKDVKEWIQAIRAEVDDDAPRLAFADWLEERDQTERAELVRVQCALARIEGDDPQRPGLARREEELLVAREAEWKKEVPKWAAKYAQFRRGLVGHVGGGIKTFVGQAGGLLARSPVVSASFSNADRRAIKALAACPHIAPLRDIQLVDCEIVAIEDLLSSPHAAQLRGLHFFALSGYAARFPDLAPLFESPNLPKLTRLSIRHVGFDEVDVHRFAGLPGLRQLESLRLEDHEAGNAAVRELVSGGNFANLRALRLEGSRHLSDEAARALAASPQLINLRRLDLKGTGITDEGAKALAASPHLRNLTDLDLTLTGVSAAGVWALIESPNLPRLGRIDLLDWPGLGTQFPLWRWPARASTKMATVWAREVRK